MHKNIQHLLILIFLFAIASLSGCDFLFNLKKSNNVSQVHSDASQDQTTQDQLNVNGQNRKALVFFKYQGAEGKKQEKLIKNLKSKISPIDVTIIKKNSPLKFNLQGHYGYILFTGAHGDFVNGHPSKFNGVMVNKLEQALKQSNFSADILIFDTCFSSSFIPHFINARTIAPGGKIICAHGECQGYSLAIKDAVNGNSLSSIFVTLLQSLDDLGANYNSLSIYVHNNGTLTNNGKHGVLYVRKYNDRKKAIKSAQFLGVTDTDNEIQSMEKYLVGKNILITQVNKESLKGIMSNNLKNVSI